MSEAEEVILLRKKIYDPFLRILHFTNGLSILFLIMTIFMKNTLKDLPNGKKVVWTLHVYIGYALAIGILLRIIWGFIGPEHARFKSMWHFKEWFNVLKTKKLSEFNNWGHDIYASLTYIVVFILLIIQVASGLVLAATHFTMGPISFYLSEAEKKSPLSRFLKETHEIIYYTLMVFIVVHVGMIIFHEFKRKIPLAQSIVSGWQYRSKK